MDTVKTIATAACFAATLGLVSFFAGCHGGKPEATPAPPASADDVVPQPLPVLTFVEYVPTPNDVVDRMLELAEVTARDVLYDLGCGDGRILVAAAKTYGCHTRGCDLDPLRVGESRANALENGVADLVTVELKELSQWDLRGATVVTMYLSPAFNASLLGQFKQLQPGARIISHNFPIPGIRHESLTKMTSQEDGDMHHIYLYRCPLEKAASLED